MIDHRFCAFASWFAIYFVLFPKQPTTAGRSHCRFRCFMLFPAQPSTVGRSHFLCVVYLYYVVSNAAGHGRDVSTWFAVPLLYVISSVSDYGLEVTLSFLQRSIMLVGASVSFKGSLVRVSSGMHGHLFRIIRYFDPSPACIGIGSSCSVACFCSQSLHERFHVCCVPAVCAN